MQIQTNKRLIEKLSSDFLSYAENVFKCFKYIFFENFAKSFAKK